MGSSYLASIAISQFRRVRIFGLLVGSHLLTQNLRTAVRVDFSLSAHDLEREYAANNGLIGWRGITQFRVIKLIEIDSDNYTEVKKRTHNVFLSGVRLSYL